MVDVRRLEQTRARRPLGRRSTGAIDNLSIRLPDDTTAPDVRAALDLTTPVDELLDLAEEATDGLKFANCIPDWLADSILLARLTDPEAVQAVVNAPIVTGHPAAAE